MTQDRRHKALGDYNPVPLGAALKSGAVAAVEGPHERFNFDGATPRQIWIGGGIGITPFVTRMQVLATRYGATCWNTAWHPATFTRNCLPCVERLKGVFTG